MSISEDDANRLLYAGFSQLEIEMFATAQTPSGEDQPPIDIDSPVWQAVMESRMEWVNDKISRGWEPSQIYGEIDDYYYRDESRTPWDFLKIEYKPPKRTDYIEAARERAKAKTERFQR